MLKLDEFTGPISRVWEMLDQINRGPVNDPDDNRPGNYKQIAHIPCKGMSHDFSKHVESVISSIGLNETAEQKQKRLKEEFEGLKRLDAKYTHLNIMLLVRMEKRFAGL